MPASIDPTAAVRTEIQPDVWLDSRLAVWIAPQRLLVIADLHWGYAASHRARGNLLPMWGDDEIEARLRSLIADYSPTEMLWLGDIVHAAEGAARAERFLVQSPVRITTLAGNHDRRWRGANERTAMRGRFFFHHGDETVAAIKQRQTSAVAAPGDRGSSAFTTRDDTRPGETIEVIGHFHPAVAWTDGAGGNVKLPALVASPERLVLPAFSPWAAGTDCAPLVKPNSTVWAVSARRIFAVPMSHRLSAAV